jgi:hypothetical protein
MPASEVLLDRWANLYVIIGSSAGALTGLQFVVMALIAEARHQTMTSDVNAFATPTVMHFCVALLVSVLMSAPWPALRSLSTALVLVGAFGVAYVVVVFRRSLKSQGYQPVLADWLWYASFPFLAYATIVAGAAMLLSRTTGGFFAIAAASLALVFIGIHNSWDTVTYVVTTKGQRRPE